MTRLAQLMKDALRDARAVHGRMLLCVGLNDSAERVQDMERAIYYWNRAMKPDDDDPEFRHVRD